MKNQEQLIREIMEGERITSEITSNGIIFTDDGPEGYFSKQEFVKELLERKGTPSIRHITKLFDNMALGKDLREMPEITSLDGEDIIWVKFHIGRVKQNLPIPNIEGFYNLILHYAIGKLKGTPPFKELLAHATRDYQS
ncbi:MAG: hypothetical protein V4708_02405 [Bacteroidota bacterium]